MIRMATRLVVAIAVAAVATTACGNSKESDSGASTKKYPTSRLSILVPAATGGGFDSTARAMEKVLTSSNAALGQPIDITNTPGAGGTTGLSSFVTANNSDPHRLMIIGLSLIGGIIANKSAVNLSQTTPIAALTAEYEAIVVSNDSKYRTMQDLMTAFRANPTGLKWSGGVRGGPDHILLGLIAQAAGIPPGSISFTESSGGNATVNLVTHQVEAIVGGISDYKNDVAAGKLRLLAASSATVLPGYDQVPTLKSSGVDVVFSNWRGIVAPAGISATDRTAVTTMIAKMHDDPAWPLMLADKGWMDDFRTGADCDAFFTSEQDRVAKVLTSLGQAK